MTTRRVLLLSYWTAVISLLLPGSVCEASCPLVATGEASDAGFGTAVVIPGDLNGDGNIDFACGATTFDGGGEAIPGRVAVFFGGPGADATPDLYLTGQALGDRFGYVLAGAGDLNFDGHADLVVGAYQNDAGGSNAGRAYVYFGGPALDDVPDLVLTGATAGEQFGISVDGAGDVNGDGRADLIVGARFNAATGFESGRGYVYFGGPGVDATPDVIVPGHGGGERFGFTVARGGDLNDDGVDDFLVGAYHNPTSAPQAGRCYVYFGGPGVDGTADQILEGEGNIAHFSDGVASGDVNDDGHSDVLVGASQYAGTAGRAYVYFGGPAFDQTADITLDSPGSGAWFGRSVSGGADLNNDGHGDFLVGAPELGFGGKGSVLVYHGGPSVDATADAVLHGESFGDAFGWNAVAAAGGDTDGDGIEELLAGAFRNDAAGPEVGRAYLYRAMPCLRVTCPPDTTVSAGQTSTRQICIENCSTSSAKVELAVSDTAGWCTPSTQVVEIPAGGTACVLVACTVPDSMPCGSLTTLDVQASLVECAVVSSACTTRVFVESANACLQVDCPQDTLVTQGEGFARQFCLSNCGDDPAELDYVLHDSADWCAPLTGQITLAAGETRCLTTHCTALAGCGEVDTLRLDVTSETCPALNRSCTTRVFSRPAPLVVQKLELKARDGDVGFGNAVLTPGDLNGDGHDDVVVGADGGRAYLYFGGPSNDDVPDVVFTSAFAGDRFGVAVAASDVNGDGSLDVLVGAFRGGSGNDAGRVYVYYGGPGIDAAADLVFSGVPGEQLGLAVDGVGDVNADGWDDLLVGARFNDSGGFEAGRAYVYYGGPASDAIADLVIPAQTAGERMGFTVARAGDLNGDGHADFLVGAYHNPLTDYETGRAYVYFGGPGVDGTPDLVLEGEGFRAHFSDGLAAADVNDDGHADVMVGASQIDGATGRAYVYFGGPGMDATADLVLAPGIAGDWFGRFVSGGVDLNLDLHPDFVVGAPSATRGGPGSAYVYHGGPDVDNACDGILSGENDGDHFGWGSCATGSDVNADGVDEILIGAFNHREATAIATSVSGVGKAYLYRPFGPVPVYVDDLQAGVHESGIELSWRLSEPARREVATVSIQRALAALGPYEDVNPEPLVPDVEMNYLDTDAPRDRAIWYRLAVQTQGGALVFAGPIRVDASNTGLLRTALHAVREVMPDRVDIRYAVGMRAAVRLDIFDVAGRRVHSTERGVEHPGEHVASWDRTDAAGRHVARGVYALHLRVGSERFFRKVVLLRP